MALQNDEFRKAVITNNIDQTKSPNPNSPFQRPLVVWCEFCVRYLVITCIVLLWRERDKFRNNMRIKKIRQTKPPRAKMRNPYRLSLGRCGFACSLWRADENITLGRMFVLGETRVFTFTWKSSGFRIKSPCGRGAHRRNFVCDIGMCRF